MNPPTRRGLHLTSLLESTNCEKYLVGDFVFLSCSLWKTINSTKARKHVGSMRRLRTMVLGTGQQAQQETETSDAACMSLQTARQKQKGSKRGGHAQKCPDDQDYVDSISRPGLPLVWHSDLISIARSCNTSYSTSYKGLPEGSSGTIASRTK